MVTTCTITYITSGNVVGLCTCIRFPKWLHMHISDHSEKALSKSAAINTFHPQSHDGKAHSAFRRENGKEDPVSSQNNSSSPLQAVSHSPGYPQERRSQDAIHRQVELFLSLNFCHALFTQKFHGTKCSLSHWSAAFLNLNFKREENKQGIT